MSNDDSSHKSFKEKVTCMILERTDTQPVFSGCGPEIHLKSGMGDVPRWTLEYLSVRVASLNLFTVQGLAFRLAVWHHVSNRTGGSAGFSLAGSATD
jgi:hypothetical protein